MTIPSPDEIRTIREKELRVSTSIFAEAIGYGDGERVVLALEHGSRNGKPFVMMRTAAAALRYVQAINKCLRSFDSGRLSAEDSLEVLREVLPVEMQ